MMHTALKRLNERGDTLVEVTIALAILSLILVSAFVTANTSFHQGQTAKERSMLASAAQEQADGLKSFRDSHSWTQFACGSSGCPERPAANCDIVSGGINTSYCGIRIGTFNDCNGDSRNQCFHMEIRQVREHGEVLTEWIPVIGAETASIAAKTDLIGDGYVYFNIGTPPPGDLGNTGSGGLNAAHNNFYFDFYEGYGNIKIGTNGPSGSLTSGSYWLRLSDLDGYR